MALSRDPEVRNHQEWLGYVQPEGLVVSIPALLEAGAYINRNFAPQHKRFLEALPVDAGGVSIPEIREFPTFAKTVFEWSEQDLYGGPGAAEVPASLEAALPDYGETLRPTYALREFQPTPERHWIMLIQVLPGITEFDKVKTDDSRHWQASPQARFERLLRHTKVPIGLLVNQRQIRLVYVPEKELSGHITFNLADMVTVAGRPIFAAMHMLLCADRLYNVCEKERLPTILANSRKYQNTVSTQLAEQVVEALYELLRGFQGANDQAKSELLREVLAHDPDHVYRGLLTVLLRLVFLLFAEDRGLLSSDSLYQNHYSVTGLYERLREDNGRYADLMDQRYGAWAQLLVLYRLIYSGGAHGEMRIPAREGYLFDPDRYLFLEGRQKKQDPAAIPQVSDGVLFRVLEKLMVLDGERLSYKTLAVEQIGSVYQAIMGFGLQVATGRSIAVKPTKKHGAPATIDLETLLATAPDKRAKWFADATDQKLTGAAAEALKSAAGVEELLVSLERKIATKVTPNPVPKGAMIFQATDERRRSGSHYTPTELTRPIVEAALDPVLKQLGEKPAPAQILNLKVCDLAMGSAAFLVEACRQLGTALVDAWHAHNETPPIPPDEDEHLAAMRQVAQRCLYGLDKNPMATDLAKLSLWLATLAKDHPFTFLDHSLRSGDALVGLTRKQIAAFHWEPTQQQSFLEDELRSRIGKATEARQRILNARDSIPYAQLEQELGNVEQALSLPRMVGDAAIAAFFSAEKNKQREEARKSLLATVAADLKKQGFISLKGEVDQAVAKLKNGSKGIGPFHWELEFPEVFTTDQNGNVTGGFDVIVGNPPFAGMVTLVTSHVQGYLEWLQCIHEQSHGNADLVAHFFRRSFTLLKPFGCLGLIATNTIGQGDTRSTGLRWIRLHSGIIYKANRRLKWPGQAAVIVSVIHISKGKVSGPYMLNGRLVPIITAYLSHSGGDDDVAQLGRNRGKVITGVRVLGMGFTFDDGDNKGIATPLSRMRELLAEDGKNQERIFPFIGAEEVNSSPTHHAHRYIINFEDWPLRREELGTTWHQATDERKKAWLRGGIVPSDYPGAVAADFPQLLEIVEQKVKPERDRDNRPARRINWWKYGEVAPGFFEAARSMPEFLVNSQTSSHLVFAFIPSFWVCAHSLNAILLRGFGSFAVLQGRVHETWSRAFGSSMKDDLRYTATDCFMTFPFPDNFELDPPLEGVGRMYYELRATAMQRHEEGVTTVYNWFHDPDSECPEIAELRVVHDAMDRAVLDAYGWTDIQPKCEFIPEFDDEEDDDESGRPRRKKYRYRWPDEVRDEVLARLLDLNRQRALEEGQILVSEPPKPERKSVSKSGRKSKTAAAESLFEK